MYISIYVLSRSTLADNVLFPGWTWCSHSCCLSNPADVSCLSGDSAGTLQMESKIEYKEQVLLVVLIDNI